MFPFRFSKICGSFTAVLLGAFVSTGRAGSSAPAKDLRQYCRQVHNDDTIRGYDPSLHDGAMRAFRRLYPHARGGPSDSDLTFSSFRCMDGKVMACFLGANEPCDKMNTNRTNPGADAFCQDMPNVDFVPLAAIGHDTIYRYRCHNGKPIVTGKVFVLDKRGFAKELWTALPDR